MFVWKRSLSFVRLQFYVLLLLVAVFKLVARYQYMEVLRPATLTRVLLAFLCP